MKDVEAHFVLSPLQEGVLFHCLTEADPALYCSQLAWRIEGRLDQRAFAAAWETLVARHAALRTFLVWESVRQPKQVVLRQVSLPLRIEDWTALDNAEHGARWETLLQADRVDGFRLNRAPLFRLTLVSLSAERHYFLWTRHHVLMDGWSGALVLRELFELYPLLVRGRACSTAAAKPYKDYIDWLGIQDRQASVAFWEQYLRGVDAATPLPLEDVFEGDDAAPATGYWKLPADVDRSLGALTRETGLTAASVITAAWGLILAQLTGREDVVFGTTVSGRPAAIDGAESIVGLFINTIPVRMQLQRHQPVRGWLERFQRELSATRHHELLPLVDIQFRSALPRGTSLFQTLLVVENFPSLADHGQVVDGLRIEPVVEFSRNNYPLTVKVRLQPHLEVDIAAARSRLDAAAVEHIGHRFEDMLTRIVREVDAPLEALVPANRAPTDSRRPADGHRAHAKAALESRFERHVSSTVEIGEVETCLRGHEEVAAAVVMAHPGDDGRPGRCAYVVLRSGAVATPDSLLDSLRRQLPAAAVPGRIILVDRPRRSGDKVDRCALPAPGAPEPTRSPDISNPLEELIGAVWASVLGTAAPATGDDFFALGGHSLLATRVTVALRRTLEIDIPVRALFEHSTLAAFTTYVRTLGSDRGTLPPALVPWPRSDVAPLSFAQQRLWFLDLLAPGNASYHTRRSMRIRGRLQPADLKRSLEYITARHEVLRSVIEPNDGGPRQRVRPEVDVPFAVVDLGDVPRDLAAARAAEYAVAESRRAFDLTKGPLLRATLYRLADDDWKLLVVMHHIVSDGWSGGVFLRELVTCYRALREGRAPGLPRLPVQYADFAIWQQKWLRGDTLSRQLEYWRAQLDGIATLRLPTDFPRTSVPSFDGATVPIVFSAEVTERLLRLSRQESVTPFMAALGLVQVLLHRMTGNEDIAVGTSVANRTVPEIEPLIGFFVNTLVMRGRVSSRTSFRAVLADVRRQSVGAFMHQDIPFERLVEELQPRRDPARNPFFQVSLAFQNAPEAQVAIPGLVLEPWAAPVVATRFDLEFHVLVHAGRLHWEIYYNTALFHTETVQRFGAALERIAVEVVTAPDRSVGRIPLTNIALVAEAGPAPPFSSMLSCLERWARERGDATAVIDGDRRFDYQALRRRATLWAQHLHAEHISRGDRIGLAFRSGADTITGIYAAFMAGCAYVPLDVSQPLGRLERMCASAALAAVLSESDSSTAFTRVFTAEQLDMPADAAVPARDPVPEDEAYVIFTSGSTGTPKGVVVTHGNLAWSTAARERYYDSTPGAFLLLSSFAFDSSVAGMFWTLAHGGTLVVASADARRDPREIGRLLVTHRITHTLCLPSLYQALLHDLPAHRQLPLELVIVAGEPCSNELVAQHARLLPGVRLFNEYGPTEGTVWATVEDCLNEPRGATIAIGRAIPGASCHVLDAALGEVPNGFLGELYIGGPGVTPGYAGEPGLTALRFVPDPFAGRPGSRLYATGDLVRRGAGGALEFFGRADHQVKIRGHRIELGEIESMLRACPAVADCCVTARQDDGQTRLAAYVQWKREAMEGGSAEALRGWQDVFEHEYERTADADDPEQDFVGWVSRYTGQPIPRVEMSAWLRETTERILALSPRVIVEVGCGNGLLVLALAPHCERVAGSDLSESAIRRLRAEVERRGLHHVTLDRGMAHEMSDAGPAPDLVIMNSVVQYFPGVEYLERILDRCLNVLAPGGRIFLGDVRHFDLLPLFHASVEAVRSGRHGGDLVSRVGEQVDEETELALSPLYFVDLKRRRPEVQRVRMLPKLFDADNELSLFRYDVVLDTSPAPASAEIEWRDWPAGWDADAYHDFLIRECPEAAAFRNVPHAALERELARVTTGSAAADRDEVGLRPRDAALLGEAAGYDVELSWARGDERGRFDLVCTRRGVVAAGDLTADVVFSPDRAVANDPSTALRSSQLLVELRQFAADRLAAVMVPALWTAVRRLPRTATGKLDRLALPVPRDALPAYKTYRPPVSSVQEVIVGIWAAVLRRTQLGIDDNFFDLGGHSLMATQVVSRVRDALNADVSLGTLFRAPTVEAFAAALLNECRDAREIEIRARILLKVWATGPAASTSQAAEILAP